MFICLVVKSGKTKNKKHKWKKEKNVEEEIRWKSFNFITFIKLLSTAFFYPSWGPKKRIGPIFILGRNRRKFDKNE